MCGRFSLSTPKEIMEAKLAIQINSFVPSYNIAPTQAAYVLTNEEPKHLQKMHWGLLPHWSRTGELTANLINARKEGIQSKPSFRMPIRYRRCLIPVDSFYEWRKEGTDKIPYRILLKDEPLMFLAGLWDIWTDGKKNIQTFTIITTPPNAEMSAVHNRMPVILDTPEKRKVWLFANDLNAKIAILSTLENERLEIYRVSSQVNSPKHNMAKLHEAVPEPPTLF